MIEFCDRLKEAMSIRGITQSELCEKTGIPKSAMSQYISGAFRPKQQRTYLIAKALNVSEAWLLGYDVPITRITKETGGSYVGINYLLHELPNENQPIIKNLLPLPKTKKVPLVGTIACGEPITAVENIEDYINMPESIYADFCLKCKGDSMINARIFDGDIVYIKQQPDVENGEIAAVLIDDEATLKRVFKHKDSLELRAENPTFSPMYYEGAELNEIRILGKAVAFLSAVK